MAGNRKPRHGPHETRPASAWLLRWEWSGEHAALEDTVAAVLPHRWGQDRVESAMWLLYNLRDSNLSEIAELARRRSNSVYVPKWHNGIAHIGSNPALAGFRVRHLSVLTDPDTGIETIRYTMHPLFAGRVDEAGPVIQQVRGPLACVDVRTRRGPLSSRRVGG